MRVLQADGPRSFKLVVREIPKILQPTQVVVKMKYSTIKHGTNFRFLKRESKDAKNAFDNTRGMYTGRPPADPFPCNVGNMGVGVIEDFGDQVQGYSKGDWVYGYLRVQDYELVSQQKINPVPEDIDPQDILVSDPAIVALGALRQVNVGVGDLVVVIGLGAIGNMLVQLASLQGATVFVHDKHDHRVKAVSEEYDVHKLGKEPSVSDFLRGISQGADHVFDTTGSYVCFNEGIKCLRKNGNMVSVAQYEGTPPLDMFSGEWHRNQINVQSFCEVTKPYRDCKWDWERLHNVVISKLNRGELDAKQILYPEISLNEAVSWLGNLDGISEKSVKVLIKHD